MYPIRVHCLLLFVSVCTEASSLKLTKASFCIQIFEAQRYSKECQSRIKSQTRSQDEAESNLVYFLYLAPDGSGVQSRFIWHAGFLVALRRQTELSWHWFCSVRFMPLTAWRQSDSIWYNPAKAQSCSEISCSVVCAVVWGEGARETRGKQSIGRLAGHKLRSTDEAKKFRHLR